MIVSAVGYRNKQTDVLSDRLESCQIAKRPLSLTTTSRTTSRDTARRVAEMAQLCGPGVALHGKGSLRRHRFECE
jgi:hypothetical protein